MLHFAIMSVFIKVLFQLAKYKFSRPGSAFADLRRDYGKKHPRPDTMLALHRDADIFKTNLVFKIYWS